jgi:UDP-galactopyranose mutase
LEYRSLRFEEFVVEMENVLGVAVINHTTKEVPYTREIEHKHFLGEKSDFSIISYEYPEMYDGTNERYYPIETDSNIMLYYKYANIDTDTIFAGRLGSYKYTDMEQTILNAMTLAKELCE